MNQFEQKQTEDFISFDSAQPLLPSKEQLPTTIRPDAPHWNIPAALGVWLASVFVMFLTAGLAITVYVFVTGGSFANAGELGKDPTAIAVNLAAIFPAHLLTFAVAWALVTRAGKQPFFETVGWRWTPGFNLLTCSLIGLGMFGAIAALIIAVGEKENDMVRVLQSSRTAVYLAALMATFTAPFVEELVYRGVLYPAFRQQVGAGGAVVFVTLLFALIHVPQYYPSYATILGILLVSLVLTLIRARTESLLPCVAIHTVFNGIQSILLVLEPLFPKSEAPTVDPASFSIFHLSFVICHLF